MSADLSSLFLCAFASLREPVFLFMFMFTKAIVRPPAANFSEGLTTSTLGAPDFNLARAQHEAYCLALQKCGLALTRLGPDGEFPDSVFVEDCAVITERCAVLTRPGAPSRAGEVTNLSPVLSGLFPALHSIEAPGTLDGGDVCQADDHFFIGVSNRTNEEGATQLAQVLESHGYSLTFVDIRDEAEATAIANPLSLLHLKSGIAYLGDNRLILTDALIGRSEFKDYELVRVSEADEYAANCVRVNDHVLIAAGYPAFTAKLRGLGYQTVELDMSEFQKMDGGLSCLSLRC